MASMRVISADSHAMEPAELWTTRLDAKPRDKVPRMVETSRRHLFFAPGVNPFPMAGGFGIGKNGEDLKQHLKKSYEAARPSGWDLAERLKDQDIDGLSAEVIYTTRACHFSRSTMSSFSRDASAPATTGSMSTLPTIASAFIRSR